MGTTDKHEGSHPLESPTDGLAVPVARVVQQSDAPPTIQPISAEDERNRSSIDSVDDSASLPFAMAEFATDEQTPERRKHSWVFHTCNFISRLFSRLFGIASLIFLLGVAANIPILNLLSFGYLLEVSGRLARGNKLSATMIGMGKASVLGSIILGTWLMLLPIRFVSNLWFDAYLVDPTSTQTQFLRVLQIVLIGLIIAHIGAAWLCGGKLRYFFWPVIAPFSFAVWLSRRLAGWKYFRAILSFTTGWFAPGLADDICGVKPVKDWFLPAIFLKRISSGQVWQTARDGVWNFFAGLRLPYYFLLGLKGFIGTFAWLLIPTVLLVTSTYLEGGAAVLSGLLGALIAVPVFAVLPFLQAHFATDGKLKRFLEVRKVARNFSKAPLAHWLALFFALVLALPLFFLKVETIPGELLWMLSVVFIVFTWPAKIAVGWAYGRGTKRDEPGRWWLRYPIALMTVPVSFSFVVILMFTRYISWNGALSLFENHVFLLPAPFWQ